jgi:hypothetical protein
MVVVPTLRLSVALLSNGRAATYDGAGRPGGCMAFATSTLWTQRDTVRPVITRIRTATGAAILLSLAGLIAGCAGQQPAEQSAAGPGTTSRSATVPTASSTVAAPPPQQSAGLPGTVLFLDDSMQADAGIYALRNGQVSLWHADKSMAFGQTAIVSPKGTRIAYVASGSGDEGSLRTISGTGSSADVGPQTLENAYLPVWAPDGGSVLAVYNATPDEQHPRQDSWVRINVASGAMTPVDAPSGWFVFSFSPDLNYVYMTSSTASVVAHLDGTGQTPVVRPAGKGLGILSLSPDGHHVIGQVENLGGPQGDAGRTMNANAIVDIRTGTAEPLPAGDGLRSGYYLADGSAVLLVDTGGTQAVVLVSPSGSVLGQEPVPASVAGDDNYSLLGYVPAG